jgi:undecaprenyl-phosphate 4-deoxy-4-formamido-L-arabinose transferase
MDELSRAACSLSVVVPVYNNEKGLPLLLQRLDPVLSSLCYDYEIVLVNDGSRDTSWQVVQKLALSYPAVRGINLMRNYGQHNALLCGIRAARCEIIVTMDDDLQHPPEEIPKLLAKLEEGFEVVYGYPEHQRHGLLRDVASELTKLALQTSMGAETARRVSAFRAFRTQAREAFAQYHSPFVSIDVVLTWATTRFTAIKVRHEPRATGVSNYTFRKLFTHAMNMMTGFSVLPLQIANFLGFCCTGFGMAILLYVLGRYLLYGTTVPGFTFLRFSLALNSSRWGSLANTSRGCIFE